MNMNRKGSTMLVVLAVIAVLAIATGCVNQLWPVEKPSAAVTQYVGEPSGGFPVTTLGNAKATKQKARAQHVVTMIELKAALDKDDALYNIAIEELDTRITAAQQMYDRYIGTPEAPGLIGSALFAALAGLGVNFFNKRTMYSEAEVQALNKPENKPA